MDKELIRLLARARELSELLSSPLQVRAAAKRLDTLQEPDGNYPHGYESIFLSAGLI